ncbi:MAG TPA: crossover junction endodeoxyribonuclease RuvC, partial [Bacillota bacterium]|nr:crossover junction endodeoxyribonuclease RuvC [Bacillota bacterium]
MRILGIDPGYAIMGYGIVDKKGSSFVPVAYGAITTDKEMSMPQRLKTLYAGLMELIDEYSPDEVSIEELYFNTNAKTVIFVGEARGVAILACSNNGLPIYEYTPMQIKTCIAGNGHADKTQVQAMIRRILALEKAPRPDDVADALAAAVCHGYNGEMRK